MDLLLSPDLSISGSNPKLDNGLQTAVYISLFTDSRAFDDDEPTESDRRGYWGDATEQEPLGSRLWLLDRAKINNDTLSLIERYALESLEWLKTDGIASDVIATAERNSIDKYKVNLKIEIVKPTGTETINYPLNWEAQNGV